eukprot:8657_1
MPRRSRKSRREVTSSDESESDDMSRSGSSSSEVDDRRSKRSSRAKSRHSDSSSSEIEHKRSKRASRGSGKAKKGRKRRSEVSRANSYASGSDSDGSVRSHRSVMSRMSSFNRAPSYAPSHAPSRAPTAVMSGSLDHGQSAVPLGDATKRLKKLKSQIQGVASASDSQGQLDAFVKSSDVFFEKKSDCGEKECQAFLHENTILRTENFEQSLHILELEFEKTALQVRVQTLQQKITEGGGGGGGSSGQEGDRTRWMNRKLSKFRRMNPDADALREHKRTLADIWDSLTKKERLRQIRDL